jgi:site-specific DNA-methyltransferase (adenine-specific)
LKPGGVIVWVVNDSTVDGSETGSSWSQASYFKSIGLNLHDTMIFQKLNPIPQIYRKRYRNDFEYMFVFSKGVPKTHNAIMEPCKHAGLELNGTTYKNFSQGEQGRKKKANPVKPEKIKGNVWPYVVGKKAEDQEAVGHPAPFPCELARDHILSWSNAGDIVLDPFSGSGTTAKIAKHNGRRFIGIEINPKYVEIAQKRLMQQVLV